MANKDAGESLGEAIAALIQIVFSLTFPVIVLTLCGISYVLTVALHAPEFSLWSFLASLAFNYAKTNTWAAVGLGAFALAAVPLAWVAFREQEVKISGMIPAYVIAGVVIAFMFWLRTAWPYERSGWQVIVFGIILFGAWSAVIDAVLSTLGIVMHVRRNRPQPVNPPPQQPHGAPRGGNRRPQNEPETI